MMDTKDTRDVMDTSSPEGDSYPEENMPTQVARPTVSPQEGGYFLNKFLEQSEQKEEEAVAAEDNTAEAAPTADAETPESPEALQATIVSALQEIYDPEIPVNIYELGLIYDVDVREDFSVNVRMTLTTPHCPVAESMPGEVELKVSGVAGVKSAEVKLVWEPAWDMSMMSDEARLELGLL
jgi:FeS assembly SUF system protein